ncbi:MAG: galactokinase family protein [Candidatus Latescibacterota bacterium]|nr:galactokinase family protein [Candidatus Latescibacterota bacterium]
MTATHSLPLPRWRELLNSGELSPVLAEIYPGQVEAWGVNYNRALDQFAGAFGEERQVVIARVPGQMNLMGMHIDYGGMPSLRLAVRGHDTITVAAANRDDRLRLVSRCVLDGDDDRVFDPVEFQLGDHLPAMPVKTRSAFMDFAGNVCAERERRTGSSMDDSWGILPLGQMVYLESYFRGSPHPVGGMDAAVWSNVNPSGGMSSSSALVISTAYAALGAHGIVPGYEMPMADVIDGIGTSEWLRGTRGGTADHGGMILGKRGKLVSVGVFPAELKGSALLPDQYVAIIFDTRVPRVYDEAGKEETVISYPLGTFWLRDVLLPRKSYSGLVPDYQERIEMIRDITPENLGITTGQLCELLCEIPACTSLSELRHAATLAGVGPAFDVVLEREVGERYPSISQSYPILLRRRFAFGLAEQDRVSAAVEYLGEGDVETAFELVQLSHAGDREQEVEESELEKIGRLADRGERRGRLAFVAGGYGRMTEEYDRFVIAVNEFLQSKGCDQGAVQRLGAGWGGNAGGLISRRFLEDREWRSELEALLVRLGIEFADLDANVASPGEGACLLTPP